MSIEYHLNEQAKTVDIVVSGRFQFSDCEPFREAYRSVGDKGMNYRVDLSRTEYMDSSALGMLLLLKEHAGDASKVVLYHPSEAVQSILKVANFHQIFRVESA
jgi:anti-anti-sigma factor